MRYVIFWLLLAGAAGWTARHYYRQQTSLSQQLEQLTAILTAENDLASHDAEGAMKAMEAAAVKNRNQPTDRLLLRRAESLQTLAKQLATMLRTTGDQLRRATGNEGTQPLRHPGAPIGAEWREDAPQRRALARHLAAYTDTLRQLDLLDAKRISLPRLTLQDNTPVVEALADLARLESEVLACQTHALQRLSRRVGIRQWLRHPLAFATAESNVVAPGDTYRARLGLADYFSATELKMYLTCNGRPVPIGPAGTGLVRFHAPTRPGPATWTGTIRLTQNGRDTTFRVTVPYCVARH